MPFPHSSDKNGAGGSTVGKSVANNGVQSRQNDTSRYLINAFQNILYVRDEYILGRNW